MFKRDKPPRTKLSKLFSKYAHPHSMSFIATKFYEILLSDFRGVTLTKTGFMDRLTDGLMAGSKTFYPFLTRCASHNYGL